MSVIDVQPQVLTGVASTWTSNGTLTPRLHNPIDCTSASLTMALPTGKSQGTHLSFERIDKVPGNTCTITGNIRGVAGSTLTLTSPSSSTASHEGKWLIADANGSWWPLASDKTKTWLDNTYDALGAATSARGTSLQKASNLSDVVSTATALANLGTSKIVTPEQYGAKGDGTTDDTAAFQAAVNDLSANHGGGALVCQAKYYVVGGVMHKSGVMVCSLGVMKSAVNGSTTTFVPPSGFTGYMFDSDATTPVYGGGFMGLNFVGGGATAGQGAIREKNCVWTLISNVSASGFALTPAYMVGTAYTIDNCLFQWNPSARTLTTAEAALVLGGTDYYVRATQCNAGQNTTVSYPGTYYRAGMLVLGYAGFIGDCNGEFADVGILVQGSGNTFQSTRGDFNAGYGYILGGTYNQYFGLRVIDNSQASNGTYDGVYVNGGGSEIYGVASYLSTVGNGNRMQYVVNNQVATNSQGAYLVAAKINGITGDVNSVGTDWINEALPVNQVWPNGAGLSATRPPSRYMLGGTWYDTTLNKPTFSNGTQWVDSTGTVVGNLLNPNQANARDTLHWSADSATSSSTIARIFGTNFSRPRAMSMTVTAAGTTNNVAQTLMSEYVSASAGQSYTFGASTIAATTPATVKVGVYWLNSVSGIISSSEATGTLNTTTGITETFITATAPSSTVYAVPYIKFARSGITTGEVHKFGLCFFLPGSTTTTYVNP